MPSPNLMGAILARQTKRVKIAVIGNALPLYNPPTRVAEEFAMIDVISGGRLIAGLVVGGGPEYYSFSINPTQRPGHVPGRRWTWCCGPGPSRGRSSTTANSGSSSTSTPGRGRCSSRTRPSGFPAPAARRRSSSSPPAASATWAFRTSTSISSSATSTCSARRAQKSGYEASPYQLGWLCPIYVAETDEQAWAEYEQHLFYFAKQLLKGLVVLPPGYTSVRSIAGIHTALSKFLSTVETRKQIEDGAYAIVGSPATVQQQAARIRQTPRRRQPARPVPTRHAPGRPDPQKHAALRPRSDAGAASGEARSAAATRFLAGTKPGPRT